MSEVAIQVEGLSKEYRLGTRAKGYRTLRESIVDTLARPFRRRSGPREDQRIWALRDVSFEVPVGGAVAIIGRNGAGKTTLLRVLARITEPSAGRAVVYGRVASLLEVGTGFHPELTGRENVFLNAAVLGMSRAEMKAKFDDIVSFAEVEKFIDTPVKRYSSGMQARLAFSVAAHLEPDILIVDEVLAVGDAAFQAKCMGKMKSVAREGRTVLFVSHNLAAVVNLCDSALVMDQGRVVFRGSASEGVEAYVRSRAEPLDDGALSTMARRGAGGVRLTTLRLRRAGQTVSKHVCGEPLELALEYRMIEELDGTDLKVMLWFQDEQGGNLMTLWNTLVLRDRLRYPRQGWFCFSVPRLSLAPGVYKLSVMVKSHRGVEDWLDESAAFEVIDGDFFGTGRLPARESGPVLVDHTFAVRDSL